MALFRKPEGATYPQRKKAAPALLDLPSQQNLFDMHGSLLLPDLLPPKAPACKAPAAKVVNGFGINEQGVCLNPASAYKFCGKRIYLELEIAYYGPGRFSIGGSYGIRGSATGCGGSTWPVSLTGGQPKPEISDSLRFYFERAIGSIRSSKEGVENRAIREEVERDLIQLGQDLQEIFIRPKQLFLF
ncbi:hypothetical protein V9K67_21540 [Paraflavisolibacter sp. H34]|uniref:hypothetical protein n=1 Tax=Huijunlia imazamoxiresistens TaxID=3127457 RepID=UPI003018DB2E